MNRVKADTPPAGLDEGSRGRLELYGELSFASVPRIWDICRERFAGRDSLDIDLGRVQRADSAGVALLIECLREARQTGKDIRFFNIPAQMLAIARVSSLDQVLPLERD
jgi:phospholipid transport system transporter-binding protein